LTSAALRKDEKGKENKRKKGKDSAQSDKPIDGFIAEVCSTDYRIKYKIQ